MTLEAKLDSLQERLVLLDSLDKKLLGATLQNIYTRPNGKKSIFVLLGHEWGNIGDLAISYSQQVFLEETFPNYLIHTLTRQAVTHNWQRIKNTIRDTDIIVLPGGGNMGDLWIHEEVARRKILETFPNNTIISFPQSIHFDNPEEIRKSAAVYNSHKHFLLYVRDDNSYELAKKYFDKVNVRRTEDIVTSYVYPFPFLPDTQDILFIKRDDKEKLLNSGLEELEASIKSAFTVRYTDTLVPNLEFSNLELAGKLVYKKIDEVHTAKLVVTDRLHGVLFALLAGRPVIAYDNSYSKISGALKNILPAYKDSVIIVKKGEKEVDLEDVRRLLNSTNSITPLTETLSETHDSLKEELLSFVEAQTKGINL